MRGERRKVRGQRLWVMGYQADSEFLDFPLSCFYFFRFACVDSAPSVLFVAVLRLGARGERLEAEKSLSFKLGFSFASFRVFRG